MNNDINPIRLGGVFDTEKRRHQAGAIWDVSSVAPTIDTAQGGWRQPLLIVKDEDMIKIRKITPSEAFKLMGFTAADVDKLHEAGISDTQLYKMAGNSIVVDVLEGIFKGIYK